MPSLDVQGDQYEYNGTEDTDAVVEDPYTLIDTRNDAPVLERLKRMYVKLWLSLRATVRVAFQSYTDVLEAGIFIQNTMDSHMKGRSDWTDQGADGMPAGVADLGFDSADPYLREIAISETERLQVKEVHDFLLMAKDEDVMSNKNLLLFASSAGAHGLHEFLRRDYQHRRRGRDGGRVLDVHTRVRAWHPA